MVDDKYLVEIDEIARFLQEKTLERATQTHADVNAMRKQIELSRRLVQRSFATLAGNEHDRPQQH